jgi:hypothetical protein
LILATWGDIKSGKSHFLYTCPEPIRIINTDYGLDEIASAHPEFYKLDLEIEDIPVKLVPSLGDMDDASFRRAQESLALFHERWLEWLPEIGDAAGTVAIDNATFLWDLVQYVKLEEARQIRFKGQSKVARIEDLRDTRFDYGLANNYMASILRHAYEYPYLNVVLTHSQRTKYLNGQETDQVAMKGFNQTGGIVQGVVHMQRVENADGKVTSFRAVVNRSRDNVDAEGMYVPDPTFDKVRNLVLGGD